MRASKNIVSEKEMELVNMLMQDCQNTGDIQMNYSRNTSVTIKTNILENTPFLKIENELGS